MYQPYAPEIIEIVKSGKNPMDPQTKNKLFVPALPALKPRTLIYKNETENIDLFRICLEFL